jgi:hypothetical protein
MLPDENAARRPIDRTRRGVDRRFPLINSGTRESKILCEESICSNIAKTHEEFVCGPGMRRESVFGATMVSLVPASALW